MLSLRVSQSAVQSFGVAEVGRMRGSDDGDARIKSAPSPCSERYDAACIRAERR
jgi:hypothetical protein